jgi:hypothetical protein
VKRERDKRNVLISRLRSDKNGGKIRPRSRDTHCRWPDIADAKKAIVQSLGELLWRFFDKDLGEFGNNDDDTFFQP